MIKKAYEELKKLKNYILVFLFTIFILISSLAVTALIPRDSLKENIVKSARYTMQEETEFYDYKAGKAYSRIDNYADMILLGIIYQIDSKNLLPALMDSAYYMEAGLTATQSLEKAIVNDLEATLPYERYWHGMMILIRPLLLFMDIRGIRVFFSVIMLLLTSLLSFLLWRRTYRIPAAAFIIGFFVTASYYVPLCIEYNATYLIMLIGALFLLKIEEKKEHLLPALFLVLGCATSFFDFLTTETLTVLVPLILLLYIQLFRNEKKSTKKILLIAVKMSFAWVCGYITTWVTKWVLASVLTGKTITDMVSSSIDQRLFGEVTGNLLPQPINAVLRNVLMLGGFRNIESFMGILVFILGISFLIGIPLILYGKKEKVKLRKAAIFFIIGLVPLLRFMVLGNHSNIHYFFTYRALLSTIMAWVIAYFSLLEIPYFMKKESLECK